MEKRQNEASGHEPQEDTENHEEVWFDCQGEEAKSIQSHHKENNGAPSIRKQAPEGISSDCPIQSILYRYYLHTLSPSLRIPFGDQRYCKRRSGGMESFFVS